MDIAVSYAECKENCRMDVWYAWKDDKNYLESTTIDHIRDEWIKGHVNLLIDSEAYKRIFID